MKIVIFLMLLAASQAASSASLPEDVSTDHVVETRQLVPPLASAIIRILRLFNFTPSPSQILAIIRLAGQLIRIVQRIREGLMGIQTAIDQLTQELAKIFSCEPNPELDAAVVTILSEALGIFNVGGKTALSLLADPAGTAGGNKDAVTTTSTSKPRTS